MNESLFELLTDGVEEIYSHNNSHSANKDFLDLLVKRLAKFYDEIELFNPTYALVNASGRELVIRHILDCLSPAPLIANEVNQLGNSLKVADLGSGAGLPGIVLASAFPDWDFTLVERMGRRAGFLRNTLAILGLSKNVQVLQKDLSEVQKEAQNQYDVITFRAFRPFKDIVLDLNRILKTNGKIFAYKSSDENIEQEIQTIESLLPGVFKTKVTSYSVPYSNAKRQMMIVEKK